MASTSGLIGVAGERFAAAELARRGFLVTLTRGNAPGIDILAYLPETKRTVECQVKATDGSKKPAGEWLLTSKDENRDHLRSKFFIFVYIPGDGAPPQYSIVPSGEVARKIRADFQQWANTPGKKGQQRSVDNTIRKFVDPSGAWRNQWGLIEEYARNDEN